MKTKQEIIDIVTAHTREKGRALSFRGTCMLQNGKGARCWLSQCLTDEGRKQITCLGDATGSLANFDGEIMDDFQDGETLESFLQPEFRGHGVEFWANLQGVHDNRVGPRNFADAGSHFWLDNFNLSELGQERVKELAEMP